MLTEKKKNEHKTNKNYNKNTKLLKFKLKSQ